VSVDPRRASRCAAASSVALALCLTGLTVLPAAAEPVYPSQEQVDGARAAVAGTAEQIGAIEGQLAAASARLEQTRIAAASAAEDYNQAVVALEEKTAAAQDARQAADRARGEVETARTAIGRLAATSYRGGGFGGLEAFLSTGGPQDLLDKAATLDALGGQRQRAYQRMEAAELVAKLLDEQAQAARAEQERAAAEAESKRAAAQQASDAAETAVTAVEATRTELIGRLAELRQTSVALETARQTGLEEERRRREEAAARAEAQRREAAEQTAAERREADRRTREAAAQASRDRAAASAPKPAPAAPPAPPVPDAPSGSSKGSTSGGQGALAWAVDQIGKDYEWAADGPDTFDCSGLTSQAWANGGGVTIPRTSRDQYRRVGKVSPSEMRPGDLIFYGDDPSDWTSIWHVAMYAGGGMMVEAPRTGLQVRKVPVRWSGMMPYAGRP
jgi:cell wall-associated NlpC family hydrolase